MRRFVIIQFFFLVILLGSCQKDVESLNNDARLASFSHHISQSKALATLDGVLSNKANEFYTPHLVSSVSIQMPLENKRITRFI